jgi:predicted peroxiredoxin
MLLALLTSKGNFEYELEPRAVPNINHFIKEVIANGVEVYNAFTKSPNEAFVRPLWEYTDEIIN